MIPAIPIGATIVIGHPNLSPAYLNGARAKVIERKAGSWNSVYTVEITEIIKKRPSRARFYVGAKIGVDERLILRTENEVAA